MRFGALGVLIFLSVLGVAKAQDAPQAVRTVDIPAQQLGPALQALAKQYELQVLYRSEVIGTLKTLGASGAMTAQQALEQVLRGTGLTFKYIDEKTVTVLPSSTKAPPPPGASLSPGAPTVEKSSKSQKTNPSESADSAARDELSQVIVTGSRLPISQAAAASPVIIITSEEIKTLGLSTAEDIIGSLPQNYSTVNAGSVTNNGINPVDARGQAAADLRGLGPENTLILVNGRRLAASPSFFYGSEGTVNLNTIPVAAIDRVEIMTDGASAVYGSDAVAGVINFILKKDYQGGETHLRQELGANGGDATSVDQLLGDAWGSGNLTFGGRLTRTNPVNSLRAGLTTANFTSRGGTDFRSTTEGQPGVVFSGVDGSELGSLPPGDNGTTGIAGKLSPNNVVPYDYANYPYDVSAKSQVFTLDFNVEQSLTDWARAYSEVTYANNTSRTDDGPQSIFFQPVPTTNAYNNTGLPLLVGYEFAREMQTGVMPPLESESDQRSVSGVLGVKFTLPHEWTADFSSTFSRATNSFSQLGLDPTVLAERLSGVDAQGNPIPINQQLNPFGNGTAQSPAALAGLTRWGIQGTIQYATTTNALLSAQGVLVKIPGGAVQLAAGSEFRNEAYHLDANEANGIINTSNPSRKVEAVFTETNVPLVGQDNRVPGIYALNVYGADRWERYPITGPFNGPQAPDTEVVFSHDSPKIGISWFPWHELKLRATYGKAFRAPDLLDLFQTAFPFSPGSPFVDPLNPNLGVITPPDYFAGNPKLGPETSTNRTAGFDWRPGGALRGLAVTVTYNNIDFTNRIANTADFFGLDVFFTLPGAVVRGANGQITQLNFIPINVSDRRSESFDESITYALDTRAGHLAFGMAGTYTKELHDTLVAGEAPIILDGTEQGPERVKGRASASWSRENYGLNFFANYSSSYINTNENTDSLLGPQGVSHYTTFDLTGFYNISKAFSVNAGVRNLTNAQFPFFNGFGVPWDSRRVDLRGRLIYLEVAAKYGNH